MLPIEIWCRVAEYLTYPEEKSLRATCHELNEAGRLDLFKPNISDATVRKIIQANGCIYSMAFLDDSLLIADNKINPVFPDNYPKLPEENFPWNDFVQINLDTSDFTIRQVFLQEHIPEVVSLFDGKVRCVRVFEKNVYVGFGNSIIEFQKSSNSPKRIVNVQGLASFEMLDENHILIRKKASADDQNHTIQNFDLMKNQLVGNSDCITVFHRNAKRYKDYFFEWNTDVKVWDNHLITILQKDLFYSPIHMINQEVACSVPSKERDFCARCFDVYEKKIYAGTQQGTVAVINPAAKQIAQERQIDPDGAITSILLDRDIVYAGSETGSLFMCDATTLKIVRRILLHDVEIRSMKMLGKYLATQTYKEIKLIDLFPVINRSNICFQ